MPVLIESMQMVPANPHVVGGGAFAVFSIVASAVWHAAYLGTFVATVPPLLESVSEGTKMVAHEMSEGTSDVVREAALGATLIVRCTWIAALIFVATLLVTYGRRWLSWTNRRHEADEYLDKYGNSFTRSRGGMNKAGACPTARELWGVPAPQMMIYEGNVDPDKLEPGGYFSCIYMQGERMGEWRELQYEGKIVKKDILLLVCKEIVNGQEKKKEINPKLTRDTVYGKSATAVEPKAGAKSKAKAKARRSVLALTDSASLQSSTQARSSGAAHDESKEATEPQASDRAAAAYGRKVVKKIVLTPPSPEREGAFSKLVSKVGTVLKVGNASARSLPDLRIAQRAMAAHGDASAACASSSQEGGTLEVYRGVPRSLLETAGVTAYFGDAKLPRILQAIAAVRMMIRAFIYQIDHEQICNDLVDVIKGGVIMRALMDKKNFNGSSCARQCYRQRDLHRAGAQLSLLQPPGFGWACMHAKTFIFDDCLVLTGSVNYTHNGLENNVEHFNAITEPTAVRGYIQNFEEFWGAHKSFEVVTAEHCDSSVERKEIRVEKEKRQRSEQQKLARKGSTETTDHEDDDSAYITPTPDEQDHDA